MNARFLLSAVLLGLAFPALAADAPPPPKLEPIQDIPLPANASAAAPVIEEGSEVTTRQDGEVRIDEFRRKGGQLYLVKVTPRVGAPYFLVNPNDSTSSIPNPDGHDKPQRTPAWIIKSW